MIIKKFLHSCIYLESGSSSLIIDPGEFSFIEKMIVPEDLPAADAVLISHEHSDHYFPAALRALDAKRKIRIITHQCITSLLEEVKMMSSEVLLADSKIQIGSFSITGIKAPHGSLPIPAPENIGFLINNKIFHPGDSLDFTLAEHLDVFFLPIAAPWLTTTKAIETALRIKPKVVIPIHDAIIKDFMLTRIYGMAERTLKSAGIAFKSLGLGETFEIGG
ncbi:MAG: MBL fold metallo-hydrolase [Patescibacteria group bacterium]